jgi:hypothetical protein
LIRSQIDIHRLTIGLVVALVAARLVFHALYVPAFEGPDEPFHLARTTAFLDQPLQEALAGSTVDGMIVAAVTEHPCAPDLGKAFGCQPFGASPAEFNTLRFAAPTSDRKPTKNYEGHQPPLPYAAGAATLALVEKTVLPDALSGKPIWRLLGFRLFSVALVLVALCGPLLATANRVNGPWFVAAFLVLLAPGAAESLARSANDAAVFLWSSLVVWAVYRRASTFTILSLVAFGPLVKLTALPIVMFAVLWLLSNRGRGAAFAATVASLLFLPVQYLRGWLWGGTVELNTASGPWDDSIIATVGGLLRSTYTFLRTAFWLGEWSFFRAPIWLLVLLALYLLALALLVRRHPEPKNGIAHLGAFVVAVGATLAFFVSHRLYWNQWGGVGGWYAWGWYPWVAFAFRDQLVVPQSRCSALAGTGIALLIAANVAWFVVAHRVYAG